MRIYQLKLNDKDPPKQTKGWKLAPKIAMNMAHQILEKNAEYFKFLEEYKKKSKNVIIKKKGDKIE
jgi:hypothetical protein